MFLATPLIAVAATPLHAFADTSWMSKGALYAEKGERTKISSELLQARQLLDRMSRTQVESNLPNVRFVANDVALDVRLWRLTPGLVDRVRRMGFAIDRVHESAARLAIVGPLDLLDQLAALPEVSAIHPRYAPHLRTGSVDDQADVILNANAARVNFGIDGSGVRVGIVSDSINNRIGGQIGGSGCSRILTGSSPQRSGDLPAALVVLDPGPGGGSDEGAAIAELIHDLAPGADILFRAAAIDEADFADGIDALVTCGAGVLVDDLIFLSEPMFQDGLVAQAEERAVAAGVAVFSAAGNEAGFGVLQALLDTDPASEEAASPSGIDFNQFGSGSRFASITIPVGCGIHLVLQWNEPFSGTLGAGASTDLDVYLYDQASASSQILAASVDSQGCSRPSGGTAGDPFEILSYVNTGPQARTVFVAVDHFCGRDAPTFRLVPFAANCSLPGAYGFQTSVFHDPQIYGHAAAHGVVAVAAIDYRELDSGGAFTGAGTQLNVQAFSSLGGDLPFFFDGAGGMLPDGPQFRFKPDVTAPDGTNTTFFGTDIAGDADNFPNFFGTSAAAPHAAAVAALLRHVSPALTPADISRLLIDTARDIETPGLDPLAGAGATDALAAVSAAANFSPTLAPTKPTATATSTSSTIPTTIAMPPTIPTAIATPTALSATRPGDCDGDGRVVIGELIRAVRITLGRAAVADCLAADRNADGTVSVDELVQAVAAALSS